MQNTLLFRVGDIIKITQKIKEAKKERPVSFKGQVVDIKGEGENKMFTVRQTLEGVGVERIFPYVSPTIAKIDIVEKPKKRVRRATIIKPKKK